MMTNNEIIKALELCGSEYECHNGCPYYNNGQFKCRDLSIYRDALDLINRQKAEIENYSHNVREMTDSIRKYQKSLEQAKAEIERLQEANRTINKYNGNLKNLVTERDIELEDANKILKLEKENLQLHIKCLESRIRRLENGFEDEMKARSVASFDMLQRAKTEAYKCKFYDEELDCCKLFSDWSYPMPIIQPCVEGACSEYKSTEKGGVQ